jgi:hypothetical protein
MTYIIHVNLKSLCLYYFGTCNINTTILFQFVQYPNIDQITLHYMIGKEK